MRRDLDRVAVGQVHRAAAELDASGVMGQTGKEGEARGNGLANVGEMLADERLGKPQTIRQQDRLTILPERFRVLTRRRMDRHREKSEFQAFLLQQWFKFPQISIHGLRKRSTLA